MSAIVTVLILILLSFIAIGIVWVVIQNVLTEGSEDITLNSLTLNLELQKIVYSPGQIDVAIKRNSGKGEFDGLRFVLFDGKKSEIIDVPGEIPELGTKTFNVPYDGVTKELSAAPTLTSGTGEVKLGETQIKIEYEDDEIIRNIPGIISWWKLDEDFRDSVGKNHVTEINNAPEFVAGKIDKAVEFGRGGYPNSTDNDYIVIAPGEDLQFGGNGLSLFPWVKQDSSTGDKYLFGNTIDWAFFNGPGQYRGGYGLLIKDNKMHLQAWTEEESASTVSWEIENSEIIDTSWHHLGVTFNGSEATFFVDGTEGDSYLKSSNLLPSNYSFCLGALARNPAYFGLNGNLDNVMVFDRALTNKEINALYESPWN